MQPGAEHVVEEANLALRAQCHCQQDRPLEVSVTKPSTSPESQFSPGQNRKVHRDKKVEEDLGHPTNP